MKRQILVLAWVVLLSAVNCPAQEIAPPKLTPGAQSEKHRDRLREGVALHDRGAYDEAIAVYEEILKENRDDVTAMYELAFSCSAKKEHRKSLEIALKGAQYKSDLLPGFYTVIGNNLDHLGERDKAIKVYREGIKLFSTNVMLHYNLAIALLGANKPDEAKDSLKAAVSAAPDHPSSHLGLSQIYESQNYRIPALLAACRFLVLEPKSARSAPVFEMVNRLLQRGVAQKGIGQISVQVDPSEKTDEGDFTAVSAVLSLVAAGRHLEKNKGKSEIRLLIDQLSTFLVIMSESGSEKKDSGFAWRYYWPYFSEMARRKLVEPFCYHIAQSAQSDEVAKWLEKNGNRVRDFLEWSKAYQWAKP
jgi:tetratricopeptide (TPR) repeat protein